jgi:hypothetical protein
VRGPCGSGGWVEDVNRALLRRHLGRRRRSGPPGVRRNDLDLRPGRQSITRSKRGEGSEVFVCAPLGPVATLANRLHVRGEARSTRGEWIDMLFHEANIRTGCPTTHAAIPVQEKDRCPGCLATVANRRRVGAL